jgi:hypothetical protein
MITLNIEIAEQHLKAALGALAPFAPPESIKLYQQIPCPGGENDQEEHQFAQIVAKAIRPQPNQPMRKEALQKLLGGHDTFTDQKGEPDPALRNAMGAISKALKSVFSHDKAIQRLAIPKKTYFDDGHYMGTIYLLTPLGAKVRDILKAEKSI